LLQTEVVLLATSLEEKYTDKDSCQQTYNNKDEALMTLSKFTLL
jgi:hypothetical protein